MEACRQGAPLRSAYGLPSLRTLAGRLWRDQAASQISTMSQSHCRVLPGETEANPAREQELVIKRFIAI